LCAYTANIPTNVTTTNVNNNVLIQWVEPQNNGGSAISGYKIFIQQD
jgi:hypothetical protein